MTPLKGVRILDLTHALAGPFCTYHLGLLGAEIVKVEPPRVGDDFRDFAPDTFDAVNGGKQSVTIDLKQEAGRALLHDLARGADVLIENFRPDAARKLGVDWDVLRAANPKLVYCSISGFGASGPRAAWPAVEWSVQAAAGLSAMYLDDDADPRDLGIGMLDIFSGTSAVIAILSAILEQRRTGEGRRLEVTMADAALTLASSGLAQQLSGERVGKVKRRPAVGRFKARDGRVFVMAAHQRWFGKLAEVLGAPSLLDDERFATPAARDANAEALRETIEARLAARDAVEWQDALLAAGVPSAAVVQLRSLVESGYYDDAGMIHDVWSQARGKAQRAAGATFSGRTIRAAPGEVPALGAQTEAALGRFGVTAERLEALRKDAVI
ncbi:CoA transferase [Sphingomonas gilva]|uniref:CoA transferase n=1 Tax=Sphingomonas gilva TaxID=2305907 RepID=A0A396RS69_9SPHN|nr:CaiB/BaiF CoA-transferase family protein [Sphingomonas gilva]RHW19249.1 CoA transferase [Sphingomonas gilva]